MTIPTFHCEPYFLDIPKASLHMKTISGYAVGVKNSDSTNTNIKSSSKGHDAQLPVEKKGEA